MTSDALWAAAAFLSLSGIILIWRNIRIKGFRPTGSSDRMQSPWGDVAEFPSGFHDAGDKQ